MVNFIEKRIGYQTRIVCLIAVFLVIFMLFATKSEARQFNCTDSDETALFRDILPISNVTGNNTFIPIDYAICNVTYFQKRLDQDNVFNRTLMVNREDGTYGCTIFEDFNSSDEGKYNSFYECQVGNETIQEYGHFDFNLPVNYNNWLYMLLVAIPISLFFIGRRTNQPMFIMLAGMIFAVFAVAIYNNAFPNFRFNTNLLNTGFTISMLGIGLYMMGRITLEYFQEGVDF